MRVFAREGFEMKKYIIKIEIIDNNLFARFLSLLFGPEHCRKFESEFEIEELVIMVKTKIEELTENGLIK